MQAFPFWLLSKIARLLGASDETGVRIFVATCAAFMAGVPAGLVVGVLLTLPVTATLRLAGSFDASSPGYHTYLWIHFGTFVVVGYLLALWYFWSHDDDS